MVSVSSLFESNDSLIKRIGGPFTSKMLLMGATHMCFILVQVAAGASALVHDVSTGSCLRSYTDGEASEHRTPVRVDGTRDGRLLFATSQSGAIDAYDLRCNI